MTEDNQTVVQPDAVPGGTTLPEGEKPPELSPEEKAVAAELEKKVTALVEEKVTAAVAAATGKATEASKREIQSVKDKAKVEVESALRRATLAEGTLGATKEHLKGVDPEVAKELELAELRAREAGRLTIEQEDELKQRQDEFRSQFVAGLTDYITSLGIDPNDPRIDIGDAKDYLEVQKRVLASVAKIQKENAQATQSGLEQRLKTLETKAGQENIEANSVETSASPGVVVGSDAEFVKKFGSGELPMTQVNVDRYNKITKSY